MSLNLEKFLNAFLIEKKNDINDWINTKIQQINVKSLIYNSIDIRNSGFKIAPVDLNLFPAGFNNLDESSLKLGIESFQNFLNEYVSDGQKIQKVLLISESHDRNLNYLENIYFLKLIMEKAGCEVRVVNFVNECIKTYNLSNEKVLEIDGIQLNSNGNLIPKNDEKFVSQIVINNNDLSTGPSTELSQFFEKMNPNAQKQTFLPDLNCGWFKRTKYKYFKYYNEICNEFCTEFKLDPWFFVANFDIVCGVDFKNKIGLEKLNEVIQKINCQTSEKYLEYGIDPEIKPYCFVKTNNGTYGMGVISIEDSKDVLNLNKNDRKKMHLGKQGVEINDVIVQEGIPTIEKFQSATAEKTAYFLGGQMIGGFFRCNEGKNSLISLNSSSSFFEKIPHREFNNPLFNLIAKLSYLGALMEVKNNCD